MTTSAILTMVMVQMLVSLVTLFFLFLVLKKKHQSKE